MRVSAQSVSRRLLARLVPLLLVVVLLLALAPGVARADDEGQRWSLRDQDDNRWSLRIFDQPDPAYPSGERLRLSALTPGIAVDHEKPLLISDGMGGSWTLANRSEELVPADQEEPPELPEGSAQFDMASLIPRPSDAVPLQLSLPLAEDGTALLVLGPGETKALHALRSPAAAS